MRQILVFSAILLMGCGSSGTTRQRTDIGPEAGSGGEVVSTGGSETGGSETGGNVGDTGGTGGDVVVTGGTDSGGSSAVGGQAGEASGGTGNVGGSCQPWDCTNIAIDLAGWDPSSGDPVPEACGLVQDPCTGQFMDCGGCSVWSFSCNAGVCESDCTIMDTSDPACLYWIGEEYPTSVECRGVVDQPVQDGTCVVHPEVSQSYCCPAI